MKALWPEINILAVTSSGTKASQSMIEAGAFAVIDKAHMELVVPALYQIADRRLIDQSADPVLASQWDQLRDVIAEMDMGAARMLADKKQDLADRLELIVVLKAVLVALRNPKYSKEQANEVAAELVRAILESDDQETASATARG
jgi:hypothetical protein